MDILAEIHRYINFCHWLFNLFLADLDYQNRTRIEEV